MWSLQSTPAAQLGLEVQGIPLILHLPSGQTDPADLWDQAHHLHPEEVTIKKRVCDAAGLRDTVDEVHFIQVKHLQQDRVLQQVLEGQ